MDLVREVANMERDGLPLFRVRAVPFPHAVAWLCLYGRLTLQRWYPRSPFPLPLLCDETPLGFSHRMGGWSFQAADHPTLVGGSTVYPCSPRLYTVDRHPMQHLLSNTTPTAMCTVTPTATQWAQ